MNRKILGYAAALLSLALSACGSDVGAIGGPADAGDATSAADAKSNGADGTAATDAQAAETAGDAVADEQGKDSASPSDATSLPDLKTGLENCGNGTCDPGETELTCPADCTSAAGPQETCLQQKCAAPYATCQADPACVTLVACVEANKGDAKACVAGDSLDSAATALLQCGTQNKCVTSAAMSSCGDGVCDKTESVLTCPQDCTQAGPVETCDQTACPTQYSACQGDAGCVTIVGCVLAGGTAKACAKNGSAASIQTATALVQCVQAAGCNKGGGTAPSCGDGTCTAPQETQQNCPQDCGAPPPSQSCKTQADCASTDVCCTTPSGNVCVATGTCK